MTEYKKGDKILILSTVDYVDKNVIMLKESPLESPNILGKLEDFQPAEEKIKMTVEEKKEFDELKRQWVSIRGALSDIYDYDNEKFENLHKRLFYLSPKEDNEAQIEFTMAWDKPNRIEVIEQEKYVVRFSNGLFLMKHSGGNCSIGFEPFSKFTLEEVKQVEKELGIQGLQAKWHKAAEEA